MELICNSCGLPGQSDSAVVGDKCLRIIQLWSRTRTDRYNDCDGVLVMQIQDIKDLVKKAKLATRAIESCDRVEIQALIMATNSLAQVVSDLVVREEERIKNND